MPCTINNNTSHDLSQLEDLTKKLVPFAQKQIGFNRPPTINFNDDEKNAANPLGRTAQYDPSNMEIIVFVTGRHTKDILRSIAHELVHHGQNCRGDLSGDIQTELGYAQNNEHMRGMEREAYEVGNLCFRDWEDGIKQQLPLYETIYRESFIGGETMTMKTWRIKELNDLLMEKWGYKPPAKKKLDEDLDAYMDMVDYQTGEERLDEEDDDDMLEEDDDDEDSSSDDPPVNPQSPEFRKKIKSGRKQLQESNGKKNPKRKKKKKKRWWQKDPIKPSAAKWKKNRATVKKKWKEMIDKAFDADEAIYKTYPGMDKAIIEIEKMEDRSTRRKKATEDYNKDHPDDPVMPPPDMEYADEATIKQHGWCRRNKAYCAILMTLGGSAGWHYAVESWEWLGKLVGKIPTTPEEEELFDSPTEPPPGYVGPEDTEAAEAAEEIDVEADIIVPPAPTKKGTKTKVKVKSQKKSRRPKKRTPPVVVPVPAPDPTVEPVSPKETPKKYGKGVTWDDAGCPPGTWTMLVGRHTKKCGTSLYGDKKGTLPCGAVYKCKSNKHM